MNNNEENSASFLSEGSDNETTTNRKWLTCTRGALVEKVDEGKGVARTNKLGNVVYEKTYEKIGLKIENMWVDNGRYGKQIILNTTVDGINIRVSMGNDGAYGRSLYKQIFNCDLSKHMTLRPYSFKGDNDKTITGISITQDGEKVSKEFPTGTPDVTFKEKNGKYMVNNIEADERLEFLEDKLNKLISDNNLTPPDSWLSKDEEEVDTTGTKAPSESNTTDDDVETDFNDIFNEKKA